MISIWFCKNYFFACFFFILVRIFLDIILGFSAIFFFWKDEFVWLCEELKSVFFKWISVFGWSDVLLDLWVWLVSVFSFWFLSFKLFCGLSCEFNCPEILLSREFCEGSSEDFSLFSLLIFKFWEIVMFLFRFLSKSPSVLEFLF